MARETAKRGFVRGAGGIGLLLCCALAAAGCTAGSAARPVEDDLTVRRGTFHQRFVLTGELAAVVSDAMVAPRTDTWELRIRWMEQDGAPVKAGQKVLEFDNGAFAGGLEQKRLSKSQSENALAEHDAARQTQVTDKVYSVEEKRIALEKATTKAAIPEDLLSGREWQENQLALERARAAHAKAVEDLESFRKSSQAEVEVDRIALEKSRREIGQAERSIDELVLKAPRDGILIVGTNPREGRKFQIGDSTWPGWPVVELPDLTSMKVEARLSDVDDGRVQVGMPVEVRLDTYPDQVYAGKITAVTAVAQETDFRSLRRAFRVDVALDRSDPVTMRPGMSAKVEVAVARQPGVLLAPRAGLDLTANPPRARLADGGEKNVGLGACDARSCVVTSGLREGEALRRRG